MSEFLLAYWDQREDAVYRRSRELARHGPSERDLELSAIRAAVVLHTADLSDEHLAALASIMVDELYKAANREIVVVDDALFQFLEASAAVFTGELVERGFTLHFLVDNSFQEWSGGILRPFELFPKWFQTAGLTYICPQYIALRMMEEKGIDRSRYLDSLAEYDVAARYLASRFVGRCHEEKEHYIFLDTRWNEEAFDQSMTVRNEPGTITVIRTDPPVVGSKCRVKCVDRDGQSMFIPAGLR